MTAALHDYVRISAERDADAVALVMGDERLSYAQLERLSNRVARQLADAGCRPGDRVCLLVAKSPVAIAAMLGTLKAGCAYVPVDLASPPARAGRIVLAAEPAVTLVSARGAELCTALRGGRIGALDAAAARALGDTATFDRTAIDGQSGEPFAPVGGGGSGGDRLAHILFTSGSTGAPKGVMISHANVRAFVEWAVAHFGIRPGDRLSGHPPLHFDLSTFDVYGALAAGAQLHLVPGDLVMARRLGEFVASHALTQWFSVPSAMTYMARHGGLPQDGFPSLERVLWCGEVLPVPVLAQWMERVPAASFTNLYGPTEATIASSFHVVDQIPADLATPIPIGRPCAGEEVFVLGDDGRVAPPGEVGEIHIAGEGLSPGYWRDEATTAAAFFNHSRGRAYRTGDLGRVDAEGTLHFGGRRDAQIKSRGYRIELGEIEAAIAALPEVAECAVVAVPDTDFAGTTICCAFAPARGWAGELVGVRSALRDVLPGYMLPSRWRRMDALPSNGNGKIDRPALTALFMAPTDPVAPTDPGRPRVTVVLSELHEIVRDVIGVEPPDDDIDLIESGLIDSLTLISLLAQLETAFSVTIPLEDLDLEDVQTLGRVASLIAHLRGEALLQEPRDQTAELLRVGDGAPIFLIPGSSGGVLGLRPLARALRTTRPVYGLEPQSLVPAGERPSIEELAEVVVDSVLATSAERCTICGISFGGLIAYEAARRLKAAGCGVDRVLLFDSGPSPHSLGRVAYVVFRAGQPFRLLRYLLPHLPTRIPDILGRARRRRGERQSAGSARAPRRLTETQLVVRAATAGYRVPRYSGDVTLLRSETVTLLTIDPAKVWQRRVTGEFVVDRIPGHHADFLRGARLGGVAERVSRVL